MKKIGKVLLFVLLAVLAAAVVYVAYVLIAYHRIPDNQPLTVEKGAADSVQTDRDYTIVSWNIGFGAYESDYGFFMDGGHESWAWSPERLDANMAQIADRLEGLHPDLLLVQEVDVDSTRSYHRDEYALLQQALTGEKFDATFAMNYDSPFLFYPFYQPHGSSKSGLATFSSFPIAAALRRSLPIEESLMKLIDLDRCYCVNRIPMANGKELVLYNLHLSAYTSDGTVAVEQMEMLKADMQKEYEAGNYCIAGGDFNKDLLGDSSAYFGAADQEYTWAQPLPADMFNTGNVSLVSIVDPARPIPSCRNADGPYHEGQYVVTVDGFMVTDNITVGATQVIDTGFANSDHNPVKMVFRLAG